MAEMSDQQAGSQCFVSCDVVGSRRPRSCWVADEISQCCVIITCDAGVSRPPALTSLLTSSPSNVFTALRSLCMCGLSVHSSSDISNKSVYLLSVTADDRGRLIRADDKTYHRSLRIIASICCTLCKRTTVRYAVLTRYRER